MLFFPVAVRVVYSLYHPLRCRVWYRTLRVRREAGQALHPFASDSDATKGFLTALGTRAGGAGNPARSAI